MDPIYEKERVRLQQRIHGIMGTPLARDLRRYREQINKLPEITKRQTRAIPTETRKGIRYRAGDELQLLHAFLDERGIPP